MTSSLIAFVSTMTPLGFPYLGPKFDHRNEQTIEHYYQ
jgi:hypothetical protein